MKKMLSVFGFIGLIMGIMVCSLLAAGCIGFGVDSFINEARHEHRMERGFQKPMPKENKNYQKIESKKSIDKITL